MKKDQFSEKVEAWRQAKGIKTIGSLDNVFAERSFAFLLLILMLPTATPLPTGGLSYILEVSAMLVAIQMLAGRQKLWLPERWRRYRLGKIFKNKLLPFLIRIIRSFEKYSKPRFSKQLDSQLFYRVNGIIILILILFATFAPPFSGLDTLPSLGVVIIALGLLLSDFLVYLLGVIIGCIGIGSVIFLGNAALNFFTGLL